MKRFGKLGSALLNGFFACAAGVMGLIAYVTPLGAQTIDLRLSVKFILSTNNLLPWNTANFGTSSYGLNTPGDVSNNIAYANTLLESNWRGYRFQLAEVVLLTNVAQWFSVEARSESSRNALDAAAKADPARYAYRNNAVNIYINNTSSGYCSFPGDRDVILLGSGAYDTLILHEVGHYFDLRHTHEGEGFWISYRTLPCPQQDCDCPVLSGGDDDGISDTISDHECWNRSDLAANNAGASETDLDNVFRNIMSYHLPQDRFTERQLDRWADAASTSRDTVASGRTWFVARTGICELPAGRSRCVPLVIPVNGPFAAIADAVGSASASGGDIILLRAGNYNQALTISKPVTLRSTREGHVTVGRP